MMSMMKATLLRLAAKGKTLIRRIICRNIVISIAEGGVVVNGEAQRIAGRNSWASRVVIEEDQVRACRTN
jgi:hypothetical protein